MELHPLTNLQSIKSQNQSVAQSSSKTHTIFVSIHREEEYKRLFALEALEIEKVTKVKEIENKYNPQISNLESKLEVSGSTACRFVT